MAQPTYTCEVIVLRKTKLGESDLILTCLAADGSQVRVVAKGARKPSSTFSSRLELFSHAKILVAKGRNLDIVKEASLLDGFDALRSQPERTAAASVVCEFLYKVSEQALPVDRLFEMALSSLGHMAQADLAAVDALAAATVLKGFAFSGLRPELNVCVGCGNDVEPREGLIWFSYSEGGIVCGDCAGSLDCLGLDAGVIGWLRALLYGTFAQISDMDGADASYACLQICQQWCRAHIGSPLKSIDFLLTSPLC